MTRQSPHFIFIAPPANFVAEETRSEAQQSPSLCDAWKKAICDIFPTNAEPPFTVVEGKLQEIDPKLLRSDCLVSPANSFGIMDGGIDFYISLAFQGPTKEFWSLTNHVQSILRERWMGFAPPGTCTLVPLPDDVSGPGKNAWDMHTLAVMPTMRKPDDVSWHQDLVYNIMWCLLVEIAHWNANTSHDERKIERVVMSGLGTGTGGITVERCANQMVLAVKHFLDPLPDNVRWKDIYPRMGELEGYIE